MIDFDHISGKLFPMPRVAQEVVDSRREAMGELLRDRAYLPVAELCERFNISQATARRDLNVLSQLRGVVRTFGGALADYDQKFAPFDERLGVSASAKARIAKVARRLIEPGMTVFLDAGTTLFAVAEAIRVEPVQVDVVTNSLAVAEKLARVAGVNVDLLGGRLLPNQSVLLGEKAERSARRYRFDLALVGAEAMNGQGVWNSAANVIDLQRAVVSRSARHAVCADAGKFGKVAPALLATWTDVDLIVCDATLGRARSDGMTLSDEHYLKS